MTHQRKSGILLHITSLPGEYGIGDLGPSATKFVDFLSKSHQRYWQILPINPTDGINEHSPYSSSSAFAGNILLISPELLVEDGLISKEDIKDKPNFPADQVDFKKVEAYKSQLFEIAAKNFGQSLKSVEEFEQFVSINASWLNDYALFVTIKAHLNGIIWTDWPEHLRKREKKALEEFAQIHAKEIGKVKFLQFLFFKQWGSLRKYCSRKKIKLIGDLPIYMNFDSADVWAKPENYKLDGELKPIVVAGVPPDYFSDTGQRWGNPVYNWEKLRQDEYFWWIQRFSQNFRLFDIVRIDHFRGLVQCWEIPAAEETAVNGKWADVPTAELLTTLEETFTKPLSVIAEDLGFITDDVREVIRQFDLPGMKVLQFAFNENMEEHPYLPHNYSDRCVVYTGTHDNNTVRGWYQNDIGDNERNNLRQYLNKDITEDSICSDLIQLALDSKAEYAIIPMQDILGLNGESRMNKPATMDGNWRWRVQADMINDTVIKHVADVTAVTGRG